MPRSFDDIYQIAPPAAVKRLTAFRETHPCRTYEKEGMLYRVWDLGQGEESGKQAAVAGLKLLWGQQRELPADTPPQGLLFLSRCGCSRYDHRQLWRPPDL